MDVGIEAVDSTRPYFRVSSEDTKDTHGSVFHKKGRSHQSSKMPGRLPKEHCKEMWKTVDGWNGGWPNGTPVRMGDYTVRRFNNENALRMK